jgi:hypothetical protein
MGAIVPYDRRGSLEVCGDGLEQWLTKSQVVLTVILLVTPRKVWWHR